MASGYSQTSSDAGPARLRSSQAEYLMELAIGTPPVPFVALADTGSIVTWTQCKPCKHCFPQDTPVYDTADSSSFSPVPCASATCWPGWGSNCTASSPSRYRVAYADGSYSTGVLGTETITFGLNPGAPGASVGGIVFGCGVPRGAGWRRQGLLLPHRLLQHQSGQPRVVRLPRQAGVTNRRRCCRRTVDAPCAKPALPVGLLRLPRGRIARQRSSTDP
ncbi:unnamed protein product [Miscanthus lutarioriparius]|uniref:Peptidase A1 domain-containing protein n=1 Tax=Miscanthus lutarioriparius TaxID=422564 RepID=A0A811PYZ4_9POAL|nr:unnamed protein product [Miscanthus lutarioriparius]